MLLLNMDIDDAFDLYVDLLTNTILKHFYMVNKAGMS